MRPLFREKRKSVGLPLWVDGLLLVGALGMAVVEGMHGQWVWVVLFLIAGVFCGIGFLVRLMGWSK